LRCSGLSWKNFATPPSDKDGAGSGKPLPDLVGEMKSCGLNVDKIREGANNDWTSIREKFQTHRKICEREYGYNPKIHTTDEPCTEGKEIRALEKTLSEVLPLLGPNNKTIIRIGEAVESRSAGTETRTARIEKLSRKIRQNYIVKDTHVGTQKVLKYLNRQSLFSAEGSVPGAIRGQHLLLICLLKGRGSLQIKKKQRIIMVKEQMLNMTDKKRKVLVKRMENRCKKLLGAQEYQRQINKSLMRNLRLPLHLTRREIEETTLEAVSSAMLIKIYLDQKGKLPPGFKALLREAADICRPLINSLQELKKKPLSSA